MIKIKKSVAKLSLLPLLFASTVIYADNNHTITVVNITSCKVTDMPDGTQKTENVPGVDLSASFFADTSPYVYNKIIHAGESEDINLGNDNYNDGVLVLSPVQISPSTKDNTFHIPYPLGKIVYAYQIDSSIAYENIKIKASYLNPCP